MHIGAAKVFGADDLAGGGLHQRRAAEEDRALLAHDDRLVAHRRHIGAAGGARAHHRGDLRDALRGQVGLVEEDAAEMLAVREDLVLHRQERAAGIDQVDAGQAVLPRDLLRAQMLLHRDREIRAALHRGVVGDDDAFAAGDAADAGDDAGRRHLVVVHAVGGKLRQFQERRAGIDQSGDPIARQQLAACEVPLARRLAAALRASRRSRAGRRPGAHASALAANRRSAGRCRSGACVMRGWNHGSDLRDGERVLRTIVCRACGHRVHAAVRSIMPSRGTVRGRSACGGSRWCRRRSRRAWRRAAAGRWDSR